MMSRKHLNLHIKEFDWKQHLRERDTMEQMEIVLGRLLGRTLGYRKLVW